MKRRLSVENRMLIEQLLRLNYKLKDIAYYVDSTSSTVSREIKNRRITGKGDFKECNKTKRFPYVCNGCNIKTYCRKKKYYYNNIKDEFPRSIQTFYNYVHKGYFSSINDEMLPRAYSYKPRKRTNEKPTIRFDNVIRFGRTLKDMNKYIEIHPNSNIVEMDTVIGKFEDKKCIMTLYFRNSKLMLMFLIDKYKPDSVSNVFKKLRKQLGSEIFKILFEVILTDNGWEFSKPEDIEFDQLTGEKQINVFYCEPYSSWQKGGIERNHEFIRYIIPKGITFDKLTNENIIDMMNNINNVLRKSLNFHTPFELFNNIYGNTITKKLHLVPIKKDEVNLSYKLLIK